MFSSDPGWTQQSHHVQTQRQEDAQQSDELEGPEHIHLVHGHLHAGATGRFSELAGGQPVRLQPAPTTACSAELRASQLGKLNTHFPVIGDFQNKILFTFCSIILRRNITFICVQTFIDLKYNNCYFQTLRLQSFLHIFCCRFLCLGLLFRNYYSFFSFVFKFYSRIFSRYCKTYF